MDDARVQHARQPHVGRPSLFGAHFRADDGILERLADDGVLAHWLHRWISFNAESPDAGELTLHRYRQLQLLVLDEIAIRNALATSRGDAVFHGKLVFGHAEFFGREVEQRLERIRCCFADVRRTAAQKVEGTTAIGRAIGIARNYRRDGLERDAQLFRNNLSVGGERRALAEVALSGTDQDCIVGVDLDPGTPKRGIERIHVESRFGVRLEDAGPDHFEPHNQCAACFDELAAGESRSDYASRIFAHAGHGLPPLRHQGGGVLYGFNDRDVGAAAAQIWRRTGVRECILNLRHTRTRIAFEQFGGLDHHAVLAESALRGLFFNPCLLHRMQGRLRLLVRESLLLGPARRKTFERCDLGVRNAGYGRYTRSSFFAVDQNSAGSALGEAAAKLRTD